MGQQHKYMKRKLKSKEQEDATKDQLPPAVRSSDEPLPKKLKWINRTRVLVFATRGITYRDRHLMQDLKTLLPHSRDENKMERGENFLVVNEMCSMKNCNKCILLESRNRRDLYMWIANVPQGPSAKFLVESVFTMGELKLTGNCLKGSRPLLSFDESFDTSPQYSLLKELFIQIFGTPNHHPKSQPFIDRVVSFSILDNRIWFRNYQILTEDGALAEIGPRFVLNPIKIFEGSFGGKTIWENTKYITPKNYVRMLKQAASNKYVDRKQQKADFIANEPKESYIAKQNDDIFEGSPLDKAKEISEQVKALKTQEQIKNYEEKQHSKTIPKQKSYKKQKLRKPKISIESTKTMSGLKKQNELKKLPVENGFSVSLSQNT